MCAMADTFDPREQLRRHLEWAGELGVEGLSRDPAWGGVGPSLRDGQESSLRDGLEASVPDAALVVPPGPATGATAAATLQALREELGPACTRCKLAGLGRRQVVFGVGNPSADLMFVGEAPGADEDVQGEPFVGRAGQLLTKMIEAMGQTRETVYIANVIKCRPPGNRNPEPDEVATCEPFLFRQIDIVQPRVIVALGKFAAQTLFHTDTPITQLRGRVGELRGARLVPTFHPAYLLRSPDKKRDAWEDLKLVMALLREGA
jgi:uracil-DNA glycosylase family 4